MATLGDLKARIIREMNRDDLQDELADELALQIQSAIAYYAVERFHFNEARTIVPVSTEYTDVPTGTRKIDEIFIIIGGVRYRTINREMTTIEGLYSVPMIGQPTDWAFFQDQVRFWPTPNKTYSTIWLTIEDQPELTSDADSNAWTTDGYDLITARTKYLLYRDQFRDADWMAVSKQAEDEAHRNLKNNANKLLSIGRMRPSW